MPTTARITACSVVGVSFFAFIILRSPVLASAPTNVLEPVGTLAAFAVFLAMVAVPDLLKSLDREMATVKSDFVALSAALLSAVLFVSLANVASSGMSSSLSTAHFVTAIGLLSIGTLCLAGMAAALIWLVPSLFSEGVKELRWKGVLEL